MLDLHKRIVIDGNDGTGKSTLCQHLRNYGFSNVLDRGEMTKATDDDSIGPVGGTIYVLLTIPWEMSKKRLIAAKRDMSDPYHQDGALQHYHKKFLEIAPRFNAKVLQNRTIHESYRNFSQILLLCGGECAMKIGQPTGRLSDRELTGYPHLNLPRPGRALAAPAHQRTIQNFWLRTKAYPQMVAHGALDLAVVGSDVLHSSAYRDMLEVVYEEPQEGVRLCFIGKRSRPPKRRILRVATSFSDIASERLRERGIPHVIFPVPGTTEALINLGVADLIFDIVESGETLRQNGLTLISRKYLGEPYQVKTCIIRRKV